MVEANRFSAVLPNPGAARHRRRGIRESPIAATETHRQSEIEASRCTWPALHLSTAIPLGLSKEGNCVPFVIHHRQIEACSGETFANSKASCEHRIRIKRRVPKKQSQRSFIA